MVMHVTMYKLLPVIQNVQNSILYYNVFCYCKKYILLYYIYPSDLWNVFLLITGDWTWHLEYRPSFENSTQALHPRLVWLLPGKVLLVDYCYKCNGNNVFKLCLSFSSVLSMFFHPGPIVFQMVTPASASHRSRKSRKMEKIIGKIPVIETISIPSESLYTMFNLTLVYLLYLVIQVKWALPNVIIFNIVVSKYTHIINIITIFF